MSKLRTLNNIGGQVGAGAITPTELATDAVTTIKIAADAVTTDKIGAGTIIETDVADGAIDAVKLAIDAVETLKIKAKAVETAKIGDKAVDTGQIADGAIEALQLGAKAVDTAAIADGAIEALQINANAVTSDKIDTGVIQVATVNLTSANILAMNGAPVTIIPGVANKVIVIDDICLKFTATATAYANGGEVEFRYTDGSGDEITTNIAAAVITAPAGISFTIRKSIATALTGIVSAPIVITNATVPFIIGTGAGVLTLRYHLI